MSAKVAPKVALVTGGAKRVGRAIVQRLAGAGFDVAFTYLSSGAEAKALQRQLTRRGRAALAIEADLTQPAAARARISAEFGKRFNRLDALVNNASLYQRATLGKTRVELMQKLTAIHVQSPLLLCQQ